LNFRFNKSFLFLRFDVYFISFLGLNLLLNSLVNDMKLFVLYNDMRFILLLFNFEIN
jgi:hypothetical protein